jgi:uroporphyrinogen-III decarboxylase
MSDEIALFGNIDSSLLLRGSIKEIQEAVADQAKALRQGRFVFINGSPICPDTPPDNLRAFIEFARGAK